MIDAPAATIERGRSTALQKIQEIEDELYAHTLDVAFGVSMFSEMDPCEDEPSDAWIQRFGYERAAKLHRAAVYGHMTRKEAPIGVQMAVDIARSERRARSNIDAAPKTLNMTVVQMPYFDAGYREIEEGSDD